MPPNPPSPVTASPTPPLSHLSLSHSSAADLRLPQALLTSSLPRAYPHIPQLRPASPFSCTTVAIPWPPAALSPSPKLQSTPPPASNATAPFLDSWRRLTPPPFPELLRHPSLSPSSSFPAPNWTQMRLQISPSEKCQRLTPVVSYSGWWTTTVVQ